MYCLLLYFQYSQSVLLEEQYSRSGSKWLMCGPHRIHYIYDVSLGKLLPWHGRLIWLTAGHTFISFIVHYSVISILVRTQKIATEFSLVMFENTKRKHWKYQQILLIENSFQSDYIRLNWSHGNAAKNMVSFTYFFWHNVWENKKKLF